MATLAARVRFNQVGSGNLILNGNNSFLSGLGIGQGTVTVGTNTAAGASFINIANGAILAAGANNLVLANAVQTVGAGRVDTGANTFTLNGNIGGAGSINQVGSGNLILNGNNTFQSGLGIGQGTVTVGTNTAAGASFINIANGAILAAGANNLVLANTVQTVGAETRRYQRQHLHAQRQYRRRGFAQSGRGAAT